MLPYSRFDECIDFLTNPVTTLSPYNPDHSPLLRTPAQINEYYIKGFTAELEDKIVNKNNQEQKEDLIRLYVSRLMKSINHRSIQDIQPGSEVIVPLNDFNTPPPVTRKPGGMLIMEIPYSHNHELKFSRGCNILYHLIFDELQKCCYTFNIPFLEICKRMDFPIDDINIELSSRWSDINLKQNPTNKKQNEAISKPVFKQENISEILVILNVYFSDTHKELLKILINGGSIHEILIFNSHSNKLADALRRLFTGKIITRCNKKQLGEWVVDNFNYSVNDISSEYNFKKIYKLFSGSDEVCKNPILIVENGHVLSAPQVTRKSD